MKHIPPPPNEHLSLYVFLLLLLSVLCPSAVQAATGGGKHPLSPKLATTTHCYEVNSGWIIKSNKCSHHTDHTGEQCLWWCRLLLGMFHTAANTTVTYVLKLKAKTDFSALTHTYIYCS